MSRSVITTWEGCPQHCLVSPEHDPSLRPLLVHVALEWDRIVSRSWLRRLRRRPPAVSFVPEMYRPVVTSVSTAALRKTERYVATLRQHPDVHGNLAAITFLERFEAAVGSELDRRRGVPDALVGNMPWWSGAVPGRRSDYRVDAPATSPGDGEPGSEPQPQA